MMMVKISELREHPSSDIIPEMTPEEFDSLVRSIALSKIRQPLDVKRDGNSYVILDGRHRFKAAVKLGIERLPVNIVSPADDILYMLDSAIERRDLTAGQRATLMLERSDYVASVVAESEKARKETEGRPTVSENLSESYKPTAPGAVGLSKPDKRRKEKERSTAGKLSKQAATSARTMSQVKKAKAEAPDLYAKIKAGEISAKRAEDEIRRRKADPNKWKQQHFNVWRAFKIEEFQHKYPGQLPAELLRNILYYTTEIGGNVLDVFGGGGNMGLVCKEMGRNCTAFDIDPKFADIIQHDSTKPFPKSVTDIDLAFLDPPYGNQKQGEYSIDANDLANLAPKEFYESLDVVINNCIHVVRPGGYIVLIIGASQKYGLYQDHAMEIYSRWRDKLLLANRVTAAYPTSQYMPPQMKQATESKIMLNLRTDILFWQISPA